MTDDRHDELEIEQHFAMLPEWLLRAPISDRAKTVYAVIQRFGNGSGRRMPGRKEIRDWLHCAPSSVTRAIAELEAYGAIRVTRDTRPMPGEPRMITRNRYLLRTSDPTVAHVAPSSPPAAYPRPPVDQGRPPVRHYREKPLQEPPPTPSGRSAAEVEGEIPQEALAVIGDVHELAAEIRVHRADAGHTTARWTARAVRRAIAAAVSAGYPAEHITAALTSIALDPATKTPGRLPNDGPWWDIAEIRARNADRAAHLEQRRRAERAEQAAAAADDARRRATCWRCRGTGKTTFALDGRTITALCTHGADTDQETA